ncbi:uncharacterized protein TRAVEDRAFT_54304 [Trametes versicolor FP-101664 SS1]|uniref:Uncharacterized protein n=1 Tax=Trametes versicolor (strain FP-101664) TaxID=717944 RepID=R7S853_TRAVS|nr:uncharacterized protein TRAVEDRAFT_54304 [Trametes versicolor FP-101664 SS1]EIW51885.1 hypothetical protein TRAVEDRAFT_54304 [Trametes versicolor FP-101664 SS1]
MSTIDALLMSLRIAKEVSCEIPIPGLSTVLALTVSILEKAKEVKDTREGCRSLAKRAARFSLGVYDQLKECDTDAGSIGTRERVTRLLCNLQDIENLMERSRKKRLLGFLGRHRDIAAEVYRLRDDLEDTIKLFMARNHQIQTGLDIDQKIDVLVNANVRVLQHVEDSARVGEIVVEETRGIRVDMSKLAQHLSGASMFDGSFRYFAREDIDLLDPVDHGEFHIPKHQEDKDLLVVSAASQTHEIGRVLCYRAVVKASGYLCGRQVVVRTYPKGDDPRFMEAIKSAKRFCDPYILSVLGYSRPGDMAQICVAIDHLETMGLYELLSPAYYWVHGIKRYNIRSDDLVFDPRYGGRVKWAPALLKGGEVSVRSMTSFPAVLMSRMGLADGLRAAACASDARVACYWFLRIRKSSPASTSPERILWNPWQPAAHGPQYPIGTWVGRNHLRERWSVISSPDNCFHVNTTHERTPLIVAPFSVASHRLDHERVNYNDEKIAKAEYLHVSDTDLGEMCVDVERLRTDGMKWKRYQLSCMPLGATLLFRQRVEKSARSAHFSRMVSSLPDVSALEYKSIGIVDSYISYTETTASRAVHIPEQTVTGPTSPLWFFAAQPDGQDPDVLRRGDIPWGFWSSEKDPECVPEGIVFDPTPQYERVDENTLALLSTWTQTIGDLTLTIKTKVAACILRLTADELMALEELRSHDATSGSEVN